MSEQLSQSIHPVAPEARLAAASGGDDGQRFARFWQRYANDLYQNCLRWMSGRHEDAEEAFSRAGMAAYSHYENAADGLISERAWLLRLGHNACMDVHRERKRKRESSLDEMEDKGSVLHDGLITSRGKSPEMQALRRELRSYLHWCIGQLPRRLRDPMALHVFKEMPYREIADTLRITEVNVRKRMQEAKQALRPKLEAYLDGSVDAVHLLRRQTLGEGMPEASKAWLPDAPSMPRRRCLLPGMRLLPPSQPAFPSASSPSLQSSSSSAIHGTGPAGSHGGGQPAWREETVLLHVVEVRRPESRQQRLMEYVQRHPTGWKKRLELARVYRQLGLGEAAREQYRYVVERQERRLEVWIELAETELELGDPAEAGRVLRRARRRVSMDSAMERHVVGLEAVCTGRWDEAAEAFRTSAQEQPEALAHHLAMARSLDRAGSTLQAATAFNAALSLDPDDLPSLVLSYSSLCLAGRRLEARLRLERALEIDKRNPLALALWLEDACLAGRLDGDDDEQLSRRLRRLERLLPEWTGTMLCRALCSRARGRRLALEDELREYVERNPGDADGWRRYARLCDLLDQPRAAAEALLRVYHLDPYDPDGYVLASRVLAQTGHEVLVLEWSDRMVERWTDHWQVLLATARLWLDEASTTSAALWLAERCVQRQPDLAAPHLGRGRLLAELGLMAEAIESLERGWELLPSGDGFEQSTPAALSLAEAAGWHGDAAARRVWLRVALEHAQALTAEAPSQGWNFQGRAYEAMGDTASALEAYRQALSRAPAGWHQRRLEAALDRLAANQNGS